MMSDLPPDVSPSSFEIRPRLNVEMEYFKEMALQETERWIEAVTKKQFKYPNDPRRSLQDGVLLCELANALKPESVRRINRLPTPIAFLDNLTVFQNACRYEFGLQEVQLFDIKDLEDLSLRGVLESEEEIQYETSRRLKNVAITVFWLGKSVRRWFKGPMLDFSAFTDIIDMSHSSQASFRAPSEASFVSSGRFSTDRCYLPPGRQSDLSYERVANYLGSKSYYGYHQENLGNQESPKRPGSYKTGLEFDEYSLEDSVDSANVDHPVKSGNRMIASANTSAGVDIRNYHSQQQRYSDTVQSAKVHSSDSGQVLEPNKEQQSPASSGTGKSLDSLQFIRSDSNSLAENAKQTMELLKQQSAKPLSTPEDDDWAAKLDDWKLRRRSQTKSLLSDSEEMAETAREDGSKLHKDMEVSSHHSASTDLAESSSPSKAVFKMREQEEDMLALFGFTKVGGRPTGPKVGDKPMVKPKSFAKFGKADVTDSSHHVNNEKIVVRLSQQQQSPREVEEEFSKSVLTKHLPSDEFELSYRRSETEITTPLTLCGQKFTEKIIKISQRPKHHKGFGFTIRGGKEYGEPIRVDKVHLGGAADVCDLMSKDEIVAINGAQLANHYLESVRSVIDQAVHCGTVELTIRRRIKEKSGEEFENDVFSEEELQFNNISFEDNSEAQQGLEFPRPLTPLPPDDEPPPLPSAPPPPPNWNTFPGSQEAFAPSDVVQYLDEDVAFDEQHQDHALSKQVPSSRPNDDFSQTRGQDWLSVKSSNLGRLDPEERSVTSESSESDKHEILMKRIHFFGLKPEDSEEYRILTEETNMKSVKSDKLEISSLTSSSPKPSPVHFEERAFAVVVCPANRTPPSTASSLQGPQQPPSPMNGNRSILHDSEQKNDDVMMTKETVHNETTIFNPFDADIKKSELLFESERPGAQLDTASKFAVDNFQQRETADQIETTKQLFNASSPNEHIKSRIESRSVGEFDLSSKASENGHNRVDSKNYTVSENLDKSAAEHRSKREFSQPFEKSKGWKSMELLRSHSAPDGVKFDPMEKARADYLSLMMTRPKPNLDTINRQYFDLDGDLRRMEEWNKKQEQLRKEKFERDQEELRRKHEVALLEANVLEQEKQKQEEQLLKKEITWKKQLEEIQVEREIELSKKQKEEEIRMKLALEKAERELKENMKKLVVEKEKEEQQRKLLADKAEDERRSNEFISSTKQFQNQFENSETDDNLTGRVESAFIGSGPTHATLEALSDSVSASSESLCSSVQLEFSVAEGKVGCVAKTVNGSSVVNRASDISVEQNTYNFETDRAAESKVIKENLAVRNDDHLRNSSPSGIQNKADSDGSAQLVRDEALLVSRRPGGISHWNFSEPESFSQPVKQPESAVNRVVPRISSTSISSATSGQQQQQQQQQFQEQQQQQMQRQQQQQFQEQQQQQMQRQQQHQQEQPLWNRKLLQDICAPPKHRLQESWILPQGQDEDREEFGEVVWQQQVRQQEPVNESRTSKPKPAVPRRTDSLKQGDTSPSASSGKPASPAATHGPSSLLMDPQRHQTFETFHDPSGGKTQSGGRTEMLWKHLESAANPPSNSATSVAATRGHETPGRVQELSLTSKYYYAKPQPKPRPLQSSVETTQRGGSSSQIPPARAAIPVHRNVQDPVPREPTSEAVSMLFDYHRNPAQNENRPSGNVPLGSEGGQKCAGCDKELGFGRCIVIDSLDFCIHPECFQCSVCRTPLRSCAPQLTNEFQILASKLHCRNCYTNEQEGLKYSKV